MTRWFSCYCGGWIKEVFQCEKVRDSINRRYYVYKKPRWQIVNCFPEIRL